MFKSNRDYKLYIDDIVSECKNIRLFTKDITYDEFTENLEKVYAVAKAFENIITNFIAYIYENHEEFPCIDIKRNIFQQLYKSLSQKMNC